MRSRSLGLPRGARVLDLACGTGDLARDLEHAGHDVVGVDLSAGMLRAAHTTAPLVRGDGAALPFAAGAFDGVVCGFALRNFVDLADGVRARSPACFAPAGGSRRSTPRCPANPFLRAGNAVWFRGAVPVLGRLLSRDGEAYRYLPRSTALPARRGRARRVLADAGFHDTARTTMTGGSVQLLTGIPDVSIAPIPVTARSCGERAPSTRPRTCSTRSAPTAIAWLHDGVGFVTSGSSPASIPGAAAATGSPTSTTTTTWDAPARGHWRWERCPSTRGETGELLVPQRIVGRTLTVVPG